MKYTRLYNGYYDFLIDGYSFDGGTIIKDGITTLNGNTRIYGWKVLNKLRIEVFYARTLKEAKLWAEIHKEIFDFSTDEEWFPMSDEMKNQFYWREKLILAAGDAHCHVRSYELTSSIVGHQSVEMKENKARELLGWLNDSLNENDFIEKLEAERVTYE